MDLVIRYFNNVTHQFSLRYLSPSFMGHSTAEVIIENFLEALSEMKISNLLQVSVDGPNGNWSVLEKLTTNHHDEFNTTMLLLDSCSLHVINGAIVWWKV